MEIVAHVANAFRSALRGGRERILVGVCGRAGAGKSTLARTLVQELRGLGIDSICYAGDWKMSLDSMSRKAWIRQSWQDGVNAYLNAINQFNWWDFGAIREDLSRIMRGDSLTLRGAYDRGTGKQDLLVELPALDSGVVVFENAILGGVDDLSRFDMILLLNTSDRTCFERTLGKDAARRSLPEIAARYLMTTYSENFFLESLNNFRDRIVACDGGGSVGAHPEAEPCTHIPMAREVLSALLPALMKEGTARKDDAREVAPLPF